MEGTHSRFDTHAAIGEQLDIAAEEHRNLIRKIMGMASNSLGENSPFIPHQRDGSEPAALSAMSVEVHATIVATAEQQGIQVPLNAAELANFMIQTSMESDTHRF